MNTNEHKIGRREFLIVSSTCALAAATLGPSLFGADKVLSPSRLVVGFTSFDADATMISASGIPAGDGGFIGRGARITATGASGASADPRQRRAVELLTNFSYFDGAERKVAPFRAWACSRNTGCQGNSVSFTVPVDDVQSMSFSVNIEKGTPEGLAENALFAEPTRSASLPVTIGIQDDAPVKLVRGYYVLAVLSEGQPEPQWSAWKIDAKSGRTLVDRDGNPAPFEHFILRVDYAAS